jgi:hypothetical protein
MGASKLRWRPLAHARVAAVRASRTAVFAAATAAVFLVVSGCGDSSGVAKGRDADRADDVAKASAQSLARVVDACRAQHPTYKECNESDELEVFAQFCAQRNTTNEAKCGGTHTLEGLVFGNGPGLVEVASASRYSYAIKSYSTSGTIFAIVKQRGRPARRECLAGGKIAPRCRNGRW